jgi:hypothetical protein
MAGDERGSFFDQPDAVIGTPDEDASVWDGVQSYQDTCGIRCQEFILEQFTGLEFSEDDLVRESAANGWYLPGFGSKLEDLGNLLEAHGVAVNRFEGASVFHLANELAQGHKVIIAVDCDQLWTVGGDPPLRDVVVPEGPDHAVVVSGIDTTDPFDPHVIVSDPGTGEAVARYPLEQFLHAWKASNFSMVATAEAAPPHLPEMANFPYEEGHIPQIADMTFEQFLEYADEPDAWVRWFTDLLAPGVADLPDLPPELGLDGAGGEDGGPAGAFHGFAPAFPSLDPLGAARPHEHSSSADDGDGADGDDLADI